jgi:SPP1 gp7 family putative phage head morphogenesis protein
VNRKEHAIAQIRAMRAIAKSTGRRTPRRMRLPRQLPPNLVRVEYFRAIQEALLEPMWESVTRILLPELPGFAERAAVERGDARTDATGKDVRSTIAKLAARVAENASPRKLEQLAQRFGRRTSEFQKEQLLRQIRAATAVDPLLSEAGITPRIEAFTHQNVALIQTVPQRFFSEIEQKVMNGVRAGARAGEISEDIQERYGVAESNAKRIANDQVGKFFGELNRVRQTQIGIDGYFWRGMLDNREREEHEDREGERFAWDDPPEGGHPGEDINCRCWADPDLAEILGEL